MCVGVGAMRYKRDVGEFRQRSAKVGMMKFSFLVPFQDPLARRTARSAHACIILYIFIYGVRPYTSGLLYIVLKYFFNVVGTSNFILNVFLNLI